MVEQLLQRLQKAHKIAEQKGQIIQLRKQDVTKKQLLIGNQNKFSYSWYQTPSKIGLEIPFTVENKDDLKVKFKKDKVIIDFPIKYGGNYYLDLDLFQSIVPERSKKLHRLDSIEIVMEKLQGDSWPYLRKDGLGLPQGEQKQKASYPTSSKTKKNWDKIDKQIEIDINKNGQQYGVDPSMSFFKDIFANGDEERRKAMIKSYQTSGGTVLSTDWGDVKKKDYEGKDRPSPPKGQEWKKTQI